MAQRKAEATLKREQELKQAAQGAKANYETAKMRQTGHTYEQIMGIEEEKKSGEDASAAMQAASSTNATDERPINSTGMYDLSAF